MPKHNGIAGQSGYKLEISNTPDNGSRVTFMQAFSDFGYRGARRLEENSSCSLMHINNKLVPVTG